MSFGFFSNAPRIDAEIVLKVQDCIYDFGFVREDAIPKGIK